MNYETLDPYIIMFYVRIYIYTKRPGQTIVVVVVVAGRKIKFFTAVQCIGICDVTRELLVNNSNLRETSSESAQ